MPAPLVLGYHAVSPTWDWTFSVTPAQLEAQLRRLLGRGLRPVTFGELCAARDPRTFAVTFDDGYRSVLRLGAPVLERLDVPGTMFAVTAFADAGLVDRRDDPREAETLSWDELRALADAGWEIGSHTVTHPALTTLDDEALAYELGASKARLERELGRQCEALAYPYGDHDDRVVAAADAAGYLRACVFPPTHADGGPFAVPRVGVLRQDGRLRFALKASPLVRRVLAARGRR